MGRSRDLSRVQVTGAGLIPAAGLAAGAAVSNLGFTPVNAAGQANLTGSFSSSCTEAYLNGGGVPQSGDVLGNIIQEDRRGWNLVASVSLDNPVSGGTRYIHLKTNYASESTMMFWHLEGYAYNYGNVDAKHGLYLYSGTQILNKFTTQDGNGVTFQNSYKASDGKLVLVIDLVYTGYTSARARLWLQGHIGLFDGVRVQHVTRTNSTAAQY